MLVIDTEVYKDYFLLSAKQLETGKVRHFEMYDGKPLDRQKVAGLMRSYTTISFNGLSFDLPIIAAALQGYDCKALKKLCDMLIGGEPSWYVCRNAHIDIPDWDHIDIIEVAQGQASLKIYGGRLGAPKMQDLPIEPSASISREMRELLRDYCVNDLDTTEMLYRSLIPQINLRKSMSEQYGRDLRSKSDAQIAETVIKSELGKVTGLRYQAPKLQKGYSFRYKNPRIISFESETLKSVYARIMSTLFAVGDNGAVKMPDFLRTEKIKIGDAQYQMGIGGLHSCEKRQYVERDENTVIADWDVSSYYPNIILQQGLAPETLGAAFLTVYESIVKRRLAAKKSGDTVTANTLKICVNGSFGKFGSKYSALYAPDLLIQTTITGQLALLMLIERMHLAGITVLSANTDGIVLHHTKEQQAAVDAITWEWMIDTSYELECTEYRAIASRDVNNYLAVKLNGSTKGKGCFAESSLAKNPDQPIIYKAVAEKIASGTPLAKTITECDDIKQFCTIRTVKGGAVWRDTTLGKAVRFYLSNAVPSDECIHYKSNGNRVPKSAGAKPLMDLPEKLPNDIDYHAYITAAEKILAEVGFINA
jgi:DNA polymerase elongation subunit (family B)